MISYYITLLISFIGIVLGGVLYFIAREEVTDYNIIIKGVRIVAVVASVALLILSGEYLLLPLIVLFVNLIFITSGKTVGAYSMLPAFLYLSWNSLYFPYIASLLLLYGMVEGSLQLADEKAKKNKFDNIIWLVRQNYWYLVLGVITGIAI